MNTPVKTLAHAMGATAVLAFCGIARAQTNTSTGTSALSSITTGIHNTADGYWTLLGDTTGDNNTGNGFQALKNTTTGYQNTASGEDALFDNTTGYQNTAIGSGALFQNTVGFQSTAVGYQALYHNNLPTSLSPGGPPYVDVANTAVGYEALFNNTTGLENTAVGTSALANMVGLSGNTAVGDVALLNATSGQNTAVGASALEGVTNGGSNIGIGYHAGINIQTGVSNIEIGNPGWSTDSGTVRIGEQSQAQGESQTAYIAGIWGATVSGSAVTVNSAGQLGVAPSSGRFKEDVRDMGSASEAIFALRPVSFRYKPEIDPAGTPQFGLVAEEVEKVSPDLVVRDGSHQAFSVRYEAVNAMLLNEFRKQHDLVLEQQREIAAQREQIAKLVSAQKEGAVQQGEIAALAARLDALEKTAGGH
jgi:hypothetical protein